MATRREFLILGATTALASLLPEGGATAQPYASYWHPRTLLDWDPRTDRDARYNRSMVPLARRVTPVRPANAHSHAGEGRVQALVAYAPTSNNPAQGALDVNYYATNYWQYIDELVFWGGSASEGLILAPNPTVTDAAHRNGVRVIGNVFLPPTAYGGKLEWVRDLVRRDGDTFPVADKMIEVAWHHGFDGWFINQETAGGDAALAAQMRDFVAYLRKSRLRIIWYDAMTRSGSVSWQNALTEQNRMFFEQSDEMFLNFWWSAQGLANSAALARTMNRSPYDLASGVDVEANGYNTRVGWESVFPEGRPHTTSLGFYRPEWTFKSARSVDQFYQQDNRFWIGPNGDPATTATTEHWKGVAHFVTEQTPITKLPFVTNFNTGHGKQFFVDGKVSSTSPWNNLSLQDVLPTWRWTVTSTGTKVTPSLDFERAYDGGSSLRLHGDPNAVNDIRLYATKLRLGRYSKLELALRTGRPGPSRLQVLLRYNDNSQQVLDVGTTTGEWQTKTFTLAPDTLARELTEISLRVQPGAVDTHVGRIAVHESAPQPILPPRAVRVEQVSHVDDTTASLRLTWTKAPLKPREYRVFKRNPNGTRTYLGGTPNDAYFVPAIAKGITEKVTVEVVSISESFLTSHAAVVIVT